MNRNERGMVCAVLHVASVHSAVLHVTSVHSAVLHAASVHSAMLHAASLYSAVLHVASVHNAVLQATSVSVGSKAEFIEVLECNSDFNCIYTYSYVIPINIATSSDNYTQSTKSTEQHFSARVCYVLHTSLSASSSLLL